MKNALDFLERGLNLLQNGILNLDSIASNRISKLEFTPVKKRLFEKDPVWQLKV